MSALALKVRELSEEELAALKKGLRSSDAFTLRRCQILLASREGQTPQQIATQFHCSDQCVREAIHAFHAHALACLKAKSHATHSQKVMIDEAGREGLRELLHHSPREYGQNTSLWTLKGLVEVSFAEGITPRQVSDETIRQALMKLEENWKRAKKRITSPDPKYEEKRGPGTNSSVSAQSILVGWWYLKMSAGSAGLLSPP